MGFIADKIRIAKDGSVTTIADPADKPGVTKTIWTAKTVCAGLDMCASSDVASAKRIINKLLNDHNFNSSHTIALLDWMDRNWDNESREKRTYIILGYFHKKCP